MDITQFITALQAIGIFSVLASVITGVLKARLGSDGYDTIIILSLISLILALVCSYIVKMGWAETALYIAMASQTWYGFFMGDLQQSRKFQNYVR